MGSKLEFRITVTFYFSFRQLQQLFFPSLPHVRTPLSNYRNDINQVFSYIYYS